jgi:hypothetical protein
MTVAANQGSKSRKQPKTQRTKSRSTSLIAKGARVMKLTGSVLEIMKALLFSYSEAFCQPLINDSSLKR